MTQSLSNYSLWIIVIALDTTRINFVKDMKWSIAGNMQYRLGFIFIWCNYFVGRWSHCDDLISPPRTEFIQPSKIIMARRLRKPWSDSETRLRRRGVVAERIENKILVIGGLHHLNADRPMETESWTINEDESIGDEKLIGDALLNFAFSRNFLVEEGFCQ